MSNYVKNNLSKGERVLVEITYHWMIFLKTSLLALFLIFFGLGFLLDNNKDEDLSSKIAFLFFMLTALIIFIRSVIIFKTTEFAVTNRRVIIKKGLITRDTMEIELGKIEGINVRQSILGRILGYGSLQVRGTGAGRIWYNLVAKPFDFKKVINEAITGLRSSSG
jgi:uncharacterized membrane protein YdbT with pleckstrin-like domain